MGHISVVHDDGQVWHGGPRSRWFLTVSGTDAAPQRQDSGLRQPPPASPVTTPSVDLAPPISFGRRRSQNHRLGECTLFRTVGVHGSVRRYCELTAASTTSVWFESSPEPQSSCTYRTSMSGCSMHPRDRCEASSSTQRLAISEGPLTGPNTRKRPEPRVRGVSHVLGEDMVPGAGFEPARPFGQWILSPPRLPFRHPGHLDLCPSVLVSPQQKPNNEGAG